MTGDRRGEQKKNGAIEPTGTALCEPCRRRVGLCCRSVHKKSSMCWSESEGEVRTLLTDCVHSEKEVNKCTPDNHSIKKWFSKRRWYIKCVFKNLSIESTLFLNVNQHVKCYCVRQASSRTENRETVKRLLYYLLLLLSTT